MSKKRKKHLNREPGVESKAAPPDLGDGGDTKPRRTFLRSIWIALGVAAVAEAAWVVSSFLKPRETEGGDTTDRTVLAGPAERFEPGSVTAFPRGRFYLARLEDGGFIAVGRECTHLGCTVAWVANENRFLCPCHASEFDIHGDVLSPPAPRALDLYAVAIENREVKVDTSQRSRRTAFEPSQPVYV